MSGTLKAKGFINGKKVSEHLVQSASNASKIELSYDKSFVQINPEFPDVVFVYAKIIDSNGNLVSDATTEITFTLDGSDAALVGQNPVQAEAGIATILLRTNSFKKSIKIRAQAEGLTETIIELKP